MKKKALLLLFIVFTTVAKAVDAYIDGINYSLITKAKLAKVISSDPQLAGSLVIPETVTYNDVTYNVTIIGENAFCNNSGLSSVKIPNSVTSIEQCAFYNCPALTTVVIGKNTKSIGNKVFANCHALFLRVC